jgi:hypothetical protein
VDRTHRHFLEPKDPVKLTIPGAPTCDTSTAIYVRRLRGPVALIVMLAAAACSDRDADGTTSDAAVPAPPARAASGGEVAPDGALPPGCEGLEESIVASVLTRDALQGSFGSPIRMVGTAQPNRHVEGVTDSLFTIEYPGMTVHIHSPGGGGDMATGVEVEDNRYLSYPRIGIGAHEDSVIAALGPPTEHGAEALVYDCGMHTNQPVRFVIHGGRVQRITVDFYVD